ncbi:MAG: hypothetical protein ABI330_22095 [Caldimonas sp.]
MGHLAPAWFDGRDVLAVLADARSDTPRYFIELTWIGERVASIRDFRYVSCIAQEGAFQLEATP